MISKTSNMLKAAFLTLITSIALYAQEDSAAAPSASTTPTVDTNVASPAMPAPKAPELSPAEKAAAQVTQSELVRRREATFLINQAIADGDRLLKSGEAAKAQVKYQYALSELASINLTTGDAYAQANSGLAAVDSSLAKDAATAGEWPKAISLLNDAMKLRPNDPVLAQQMADVQEGKADWDAKRQNPESSENNPAVTPEFVEKVATVQKYFFDGDRYFETGQYDKAEENYLKILTLDPYNKAARAKLDRLARYEMKASEVARKQAHADAMMKVDAGWSDPVKPGDFVQAGNPNDDNGQVSNLAKITRKLETIRIPSLVFNEVSIEDVVNQFLIPKSRELDPDKEGINFVLKLDSTTAPAAAPANGVPPPATTDAAAAPASTIQRTVTLNATDLSLMEVLKLLSTLTNLKFKIDEYAVYLLPATESADVLITKTFLVPADFFSGLLDASAGTLGARLTGDTAKIDVKKQLQNLGVDFPPGATAAYLKNSSKLVVKNTPDQIDTIDLLIKARDKETPQIEIETKLAEFTEQAVKEFSTQYLLNSAPGGDVSFPLSALGAVLPTLGTSSATTYDMATGLRNGRVQGNSNGDPQAGLKANSIDSLLQANSAIKPVNVLDGTNLVPNQPSTMNLGVVVAGRGLSVLLNLLNQTTGVDLLSAPRVTTVNRKLARIEVVREFLYPEEYDKPKISNSTFFLPAVAGQTTFDSSAIPGGGVILAEAGSNVNLALPATPTQFKSQKIGVTLEVTPTLVGDQRVDLVLKPTVTDFEGFINYGQPITELTGEDQTQAVDLVEGKLLQPVFNNRSIETTMQVVDGQTVMMGGLIREDRQKVDDKIPVLGDIPIIGRLFQSKVDQRIKKNLVIFVTTRLVRSDGKPQFAKDIATVSGTNPAN